MLKILCRRRDIQLTQYTRGARKKIELQKEDIKQTVSEQRTNLKTNESTIPTPTHYIIQFCMYNNTLTVDRSLVPRNN